jgi:uncharacterized protein
MFELIKKEIEEIASRAGKINKIILLGDIKHGFSKGNRQEWKEVSELLKNLKKRCGEVIIIKGNHDNYLENIALRMGVEVTNEYLWKEFCFMHGDVDIKEAYRKEIKCWIMGHAHPAVLLQEGTKKEKYKCFLVGKYKGKKVIILPSFFPLIEGSNILGDIISLPWKFDVGNFEVIVAGERESLEGLNFGKLKNLK